MDYDSIHDLQRELARLSAETREYYKRPNHSHSASDRLRQEDRRLRIIQIQAELREMLNDYLSHSGRENTRWGQRRP